MPLPKIAPRTPSSSKKGITIIGLSASALVGWLQIRSTARSLPIASISTQLNLLITDINNGVSPVFRLLAGLIEMLMHSIQAIRYEGDR